MFVFNSTNNCENTIQQKKLNQIHYNDDFMRTWFNNNFK
jgi:hypothetical protein